MPFFGLHSEFDHFPDVEVVLTSTFVRPDPDLVGHMAKAEKCYQHLFVDAGTGGCIYNREPGKRRLGGTCMSLKNSTPTTKSVLVCIWYHWRYHVILLMPCSEVLVILPWMTSPLNGRKTIKVNSTAKAHQ
jgi:hypothetical protein